jgi:MATE family multidrug resistance protein
MLSSEITPISELSQHVSQFNDNDDNFEPSSNGQITISNSSSSDIHTSHDSIRITEEESLDKSSSNHLNPNGSDRIDLSITLDENFISSNDVSIEAPVPFTIDNVIRKSKEHAPIAFSVSMAYVVNVMNGLILYMFVGRLGELEAAAAGLSNFIIAVTGISFCYGLLGAEDTLISQAYGAKNMQRVSIVFQRSVMVMLVVCIPITILWCVTEPMLVALHQDHNVAKLAGRFVLIYLPSLPALVVCDALKRFLVCQGIASPTLFATLVSNTICVASGYFLILHTPLKFYGMPMALGLSNWLSLIFLSFWTIYKRLHVPTWRTITKAELFDWKENVEFIKLGVPGALMLCAEWIGIEIHGLMAGWISVTALAAQSIILNSNYLIFSFPLGIAVSTTVLVGNEMGSGKYKDAFLAYVVGLMDMEVISILIAILLYSLRNIWGAIFSNVPEVIALAAKAIPFWALFVISDAAGGVGGGAIRGVGQQTKAAICNLLAFYAIGVPLGYFLAFPVGANWGLPGLWTGLAIASYIATFSIHGILIFGDWSKWAQTAKERAGVQDTTDSPANSVALESLPTHDEEENDNSNLSNGTSKHVHIDKTAQNDTSKLHQSDSSMVELDI